MTHYETALCALRRPRLLIRAARTGALKYRRKKHAKLTNASPSDPDKIFTVLLEQERDLEWNRRAGAADYNVKKHVAVLAALIAESNPATAA